MAVFLINDKQVHSYEQLLAEINGSQSYYPLYKQPDLFLYFSNLIKALSSNVPLILLDADLNANEIGGVDESRMNVAETLPVKGEITIEEVIAAVQNSSSQLPSSLVEQQDSPKRLYTMCRI